MHVVLCVYPMETGRCRVSVFRCLTPAGPLSVYCPISDSSPGLKAKGRGRCLPNFHFLLFLTQEIPVLFGLARIPAKQLCFLPEM